MMRCMDCFFFKEKLSHCRRYPPQVYSRAPGAGITSSGQLEQSFPKVHHQDWCGEFITPENWNTHRSLNQDMLDA